MEGKGKKTDFLFHLLCGLIRIHVAVLFIVMCADQIVLLVYYQELK